MIDIDEVMNELNRYKIAYDVLQDQLADKEAELRYWIQLFNAARQVAFKYAYKYGVGTSIDDLIIKRRDEMLKEETNAKAKKSQAIDNPRNGHTPQ